MNPPAVFTLAELQRSVAAGYARWTSRRKIGGDSRTAQAPNAIKKSLLGLLGTRLTDEGREARIRSWIASHHVVRVPADGRLRHQVEEEVRAVIDTYNAAVERIKALRRDRMTEHDLSRGSPASNVPLQRTPAESARDI